MDFKCKYIKCIPYTAHDFKVYIYTIYIHIYMFVCYALIIQYISVRFLPKMLIALGLLGFVIWCHRKLWPSCRSWAVIGWIFATMPYRLKNMFYWYPTIPVLGVISSKLRLTGSVITEKRAGEPLLLTYLIDLSAIQVWMNYLCIMVIAVWLLSAMFNT